MLITSNGFLNKTGIVVDYGTKYKITDFIPLSNAIEFIYSTTINWNGVDYCVYSDANDSSFLYFGHCEGGSGKNPMHFTD